MWFRSTPISSTVIYTRIGIRRRGPMWSALISNELNFYRIAAGQRGYKSSAPWYREHQQPSGAPRRNTQDPPLAQKAVDETRLLVENQMTDG